MSLLLAALLVQSPPPDEAFQKRVRTESARIFVDDRLVLDGPWKNAAVRVVDVGGRKAKALFGPFDPWKQIVVVADGEERLRAPVPSLEKPLTWPPLRLEELRSPLLKKLTETRGGRSTFILLLAVDKAEYELYRGPVVETRIDRTLQAFTVFVGDEVLYRVTKSTKPAARVEDVVMAVNLERAKAGAEPARLSAPLSKACDLHALYLAKNEAPGMSGHLEDPKGVGFTPEGERAGKRSVICPFNPHETPLDAVDSLLATLYHRVAMLHPAVTDLGVGWAHRRDGVGFLVIDVGTQDAAKAGAKVWPIVYPVNGQENVPLEFGLGSRETPNPIPGEGILAGYPVTIQLPERKGKGFEGEARLFTGGTEVDCWLSTPDAPARADSPQPGSVCLIPKGKLKPGTIYTARFKDRLSGLEREWTFTTRKM